VIRLEPWTPGNLALLERLLGDPAMMTHLGGPETPEKIAERQARYEQDPRQLRIVDVASGEGIGWVGYWEREWLDRLCWEIGWAVVPAMQGRGVGSRATALVLDVAREEGSHRYVHAYPSVENAASNGICRKLGFTLLGAHDFEYPAGEWMRCNDWQFDLRPGGGASRPSRPRRQ
jgi:RimJ/RimL family protein N-acetyltransferase